MFGENPNSPNRVRGSFAPDRKTTFADAFPQISSLEVEIKATPMGFGRTEILRYTLETIARGFSPCPNPNCRAGGFDVGVFLHQMIVAGLTSGETGGGCEGAEGLPRHKKRCCIYSFSGRVAISYAV
jgi:hypothetical protein